MTTITRISAAALLVFYCLAVATAQDTPPYWDDVADDVEDLLPAAPEQLTPVPEERAPAAPEELEPAPPETFEPAPGVAEPEPLAAPRGDRRTRCPAPEELADWFRPLRDIRLQPRPVSGDLPVDCSEQLFRPAQYGPGGAPLLRNWAATEFNWAASELVHQPLYWDETPLERYGQTIHPYAQPLISTFNFFGTFVVIPYKIGIDGTHDLISTLGLYRPGSPTPPIKQTLPLEADALLYEGGAWVGLLLLLP